MWTIAQKVAITMFRNNMWHNIVTNNDIITRCRIGVGRCGWRLIILRMSPPAAGRSTIVRWHHINVRRTFITFVRGIILGRIAGRPWDDGRRIALRAWLALMPGTAL